MGERLSAVSPAKPQSRPIFVFLALLGTRLVFLVTRHSFCFNV